MAATVTALYCLPHEVESETEPMLACSSWFQQHSVCPAISRKIPERRENYCRKQVKKMT
jgi:hypothetical protein